MMSMKGGKDEINRMFSCYYCSKFFRRFLVQNDLKTTQLMNSPGMNDSFLVNQKCLQEVGSEFLSVCLPFEGSFASFRNQKKVKTLTETKCVILSS